jgi:hypothetical protein
VWLTSFSATDVARLQVLCGEPVKAIKVKRVGLVKRLKSVDDVLAAMRATEHGDRHGRRLVVKGVAMMRVPTLRA